MTPTDKKTPQKDMVNKNNGHHTIQNDILLIRSSYTGIYRNEELYDGAVKAERILAAVYLITNHIENSDRLRTELRSTASELVSELWRSVGHVGGEYVHGLAQSRRVLDVLMAHLRAAALSRLLSEVNAAIVERECVSLHRTVVRLESRAGIRDARSYSDQYTTPDLLQILTPSHTTAGVAGHSGMSANHFFNTHQSIRSSTPVTPVSQHNQIPQTQTSSTPGSAFEKQTKTSVRKHTSVSNQNDITHQNDIKTTLDQAKRLHKILTVIQDKKTVSIKDITDTVTGCSEKSVQRDLVILINKGLIKRTGNKRWSRYEIVG